MKRQRRRTRAMRVIVRGVCRDKNNSAHQRRERLGDTILNNDNEASQIRVGELVVAEDGLLLSDTVDTTT